MCYYIPTEELIANVLILKAGKKDGKIEDVMTNIAEMISLYDYSFEKTDGNYIFELSSKDVLSTIQSYPRFFRFSTNTNNIMFSKYIKNKDDIAKEFSIPEKLLNVFKEFFTNPLNLNMKAAVGAI